MPVKDVNIHLVVTVPDSIDGALQEAATRKGYSLPERLLERLVLWGLLQTKAEREGTGCLVVKNPDGTRQDLYVLSEPPQRNPRILNFEDYRRRHPQ